VGSTSDPNRQAILRYNHPGGKIGLRVKEDSWTPSNNYGNLGYYLEYAGDNIMDHDGDGLNDVLETSGMLALGRMITTSPNNPDTDGDGLPDGVEIGELMVDSGTGLKYYKALSDPTKADSDEDHISDYDEYELGTNPLLEDTDHDGIDDNIDASPLSYDNTNKPGFSDLEIGRAIVLGAVFGEMGCENGLAEGYVDPKISSSIYYLIGWISFSFIPGAGAAAAARDAVQYLLNGENLQAALSLVGVFPLLSALKVEGAVAKFIAKNPGKEAEIAGVVVEDALKLAPDGLKAAILKAIDNAAVVALLAKNVPVDAIACLVKRGVKLSEVDQAIVLDGENAIPS
ncbi:MAG: hypothetical protein QG646_3446, partial [Euryarchaeota archaeon]|nr:hypothetical protein [Euryarchaeota archaeon]